MAEADGFAVVSFGMLDVSTVSPTRRGAIVNWLVTSARQIVYITTTDAEIERLWNTFRGGFHNDHTVEPVKVSTALKAGDGK